MKAVDRLAQKVSSLVVRYAGWQMPEVIGGNGSLLKLADRIHEDGLSRILLFTTTGMIRRGSLEDFFDGLNQRQIHVIVFDEVMPDPTIGCIEAAAQLYLSENCDGIVAIGGGSVLDCAKVAAARIVKPEQPVEKMAGIFRVRKKLPPFYAVPTTSGTGSETTVAAVVTDEKTHRKFAVSDDSLLPDVAVLDPVLTRDLPPKMTAFTGMDALTHAVEAYTNLYSMKEADRKAIKAVKLICENLVTAYDHGEDLTARKKMMAASFYAGEAFTRSYVGYVHAIAHAVGGLYHVPHGEANAIILPYVLEAFGPAVYSSLSRLAIAAGIESSQSQQQDAEAFIRKIREMNDYMHIDTHLAVIREEDIPEIVSRVQAEAHSYPTPVIWNKKQLTTLIKTIKGEDEV